MSLFISSVFTYDEDAGNYIQAVEGASGDNQALEPATRKAINNFVIGCKQDGIWTAIKASCILAGARTLAGALIPLVGTAPTNVGFIGIGTDYVRKTGLVGNGTSKYLNSNRNNNADPQDNQHLSVFVSTANTASVAALIATTGADGATQIFTDTTAAPSQTFFRSRSTSSPLLFGATSLNNRTGLHGMSRFSSASVNGRVSSTTTTFSYASVTPLNATIGVFNNGSTGAFTNARLAFYSIGESLDLARLDARVTDLINAFAVTIP